jgi:hypothetical protein
MRSTSGAEELPAGCWAVSVAQMQLSALPQSMLHSLLLFARNSVI